MPSARDTRWVAAEFDRRAATYDQSRAHRWQARQAAELLGPQDGVVLDVATGTGLAAEAVTELSPRAWVVGVDVSAGMLRVAAARSDPRCCYLRADTARLPFADQVFGAVLCVAAVPYLPDLTAAVGQWRSTSRPGATVVFTTPAVDGLATHRLLRRAAAEHGVDVPDPHAALGSGEAIRARAPGLGLLIEMVELRSFSESWPADPRSTFETVLDYGFAEPVRTAPPELRDAVGASYRRLHFAGAGTGPATQVVCFTRARFGAE